MKTIRIHELIKWIKEKSSPKQFILFSSVLVGLSAGLVAVVLKSIIHIILNYLADLKFLNSKYLIAGLPIVGILLTVLLVHYLLKNKIEKGISFLHRRIKKNSSYIPKKQMYDQVLTSSLTIGFGGSAGIEAPILLTGAAFGSNYSKTYKLNYNDRSLLLACGIAGGIGAAYNAPIAGVLFALEALLLDISITAFIPLILAAASGALISKIILHSDVLFSFNKVIPFNYNFTFFYIALGVLSGLLSVYHLRVFVKVEESFHKFKVNKYFKVFFGGILLAFLILLFPSFFGEGVNFIKALSTDNTTYLHVNSVLHEFIIKDWHLLFFILCIILLKPIATALTIGSGGNGGNFAPSLFVGAFLGFLLAKILNIWFQIDVSVSNFTLVGMAGVLSGLYHAPLTSIFLIAEITGGYTLMIPLMIVSSISYTISKYFEPFSMDTKRLVEEDEMFSNSKDLALLNSIDIENLIEKDSIKLKVNMLLGELIENVKISDKNVFPVIDDDNNLKGLIFLDNIKEYLFEIEKYDRIKVSDLMEKVKEFARLDENINSILTKFEKNNFWILPVVYQTKFVGFIYKSSILTEYRKALINTTIE
ncbi:MAG: chloride channel protein [Flavobacteriia bacterium]|nr:chloride channel protein [Flavobacteriia bacterium]